jgi:hypothetical protein
MSSRRTHEINATNWHGTLVWLFVVVFTFWFWIRVTALLFASLF